jgi:hypothetical protein
VGSEIFIRDRQLVERLWELNGLPFETMPKIVAGDVAPYDLAEISSMLRNMNGAEFDLTNQPELVGALLKNAELPFDKELYEEQRGKNDKAKELEQQVIMSNNAKRDGSNNDPEQEETE